jgi:microcystin-dependent protein
MPNLTLITLTAPNLPLTYCPSNYQQLANDIISGTQATFNSAIGNSFFNFGSTTPALNNQVYPWLDENGDWWVFNGGYWARQNPVAAGSSERRIFVGTSTDVLSYDGGDGTVYSGNPYAGSMWQLDNAFDARFPVGAGTFAASGVVNVNGTATSTAVVGEDQHTLSVQEMPAHTHNFFPLVTADANNGGANGVQYGTTANVPTSSTGDGAAHNNLPPFYGVYFIKRTARVYYTK